MTDPLHDFPELRALLDALCEEAITPEQVERLEQLVLGDPKAEAYYVQYMSLHADLVGNFCSLPNRASKSLRERVGAEHLGTADSHSNLPHLIQPLRSRWRRAVWGSLGFAGLAAACLITFMYWRPPSRAPSLGHTSPEAMDDTVAVLLEALDAEWEDTGAPTAAGAPIRAGWLRLKSGFAYIEFYSGATVILEGPADFQLISRNEAYCARGKLRATVPPQAQGFRIGSPHLDVVDRGTEFGLEVTDGGRTEVHVFRGMVELNTNNAAAAQHAPHRQLTTGQSVRLEDSGELSLIESDPAAFRTAQDVMESSEVAIRQRHQDWLSASEALHQEPSLLVYYAFQTDQSWDRTLIDQAEETHHGAIVGCSWVTGRWPGKQALQFKRVSDRVRFHVPGEYESITLIAWARVDALPNRFNSLMITDGWEEGEPHWHIASDGTLELGVQGVGKKENAHYFAAESITTERLGQWTHLAVVYDRDRGTVTHFVDGQPASVVPIKFDIPLRIGDAEIGNWNVGSYRNSSPVRYFSGCIDEFLLFSRALSNQQIEQLYKQGRPTP